MLFEGDFNEVVEYINIWNNDFKLGLVAHEPLTSKAAWTFNNLIVMLSKAAPGLFRYETDSYDLKPLADATVATKENLKALVWGSYRKLRADELGIIPGESDRIAQKSLRRMFGKIPIPEEATQKANALEDELRRTQPELGYAEIKKRWFEEVDKNSDRERVLASLPKAHRDAIDAWAAECERCSKLTPEQAVQEFYGTPEVQPESAVFSPPPDEFGKTYYKSYSQQLARQFVESFPAAYKAYTDSGISAWSQQFIADTIGISKARTGQIINAFRDWATQEGLPLVINGVPLPPDQRKGQGRKPGKTSKTK